MCGLGCALAFAFPARATDAVGNIVVTATKSPEPALTYPAVTTLINGADLRARGAYDLRGALAEAAGVEVVPGDDAGPASSVIALEGLTEFDAYLLVIDGVPYGGAFNPQTPTLDLTDIDRIEVLRGSAPVSYGATSFVGVVQALHYQPGKQPPTRCCKAARAHPSTPPSRRTCPGSATSRNRSSPAPRRGVPRSIAAASTASTLSTAPLPTPASAARASILMPRGSASRPTARTRARAPA